MLKITNNLSGKKEVFTPRNPNEVLMYVCGITPYDLAHVGHGRSCVTFDILFRLLNFLDYKVKYCRNFTDVDDKIINKSEKEFNNKFDFEKISQRYIKAYKEDTKKLNCLDPDFEPLVTNTIPEIINFISGLIKNNKAYIIKNSKNNNSDVYYSVESFKDYGKLSKRNLDDLKAGARVEIDTRKKSPLDFALWKSEEDNTFWDSPWGWGRPGWHIECSAMAANYLAPQIDIHGGGMDLIFPHHENEIAQSEGLSNKEFSKYWVHNAFVRINKEKMSKSLNNFFTLKDIFKDFDPMVVRYHFIKHNYTAPLEFSFEELEIDQKSYQKLAKIFNVINSKDLNKLNNKQVKESKVVQKMLNFICDDLNTSGLFGVLFENLNYLKTNLEELAKVKKFILEVLGLTLIPLPEKQVEITPEIQNLLDLRNKARINKNWSESDRLRDELVKLGVIIQDIKSN